MILLIAFYIVGIVFVVYSLYLHFWRKKRIYNSKYKPGPRPFIPYEKSLVIGWRENGAQFLSILLGALGILLLLAAIFGAHDIMRVTHF